MSSKSLKVSKRKEKNEQQKEESIDGVSEAYHEGEDDHVTKKDVYKVMKVQESMSRNLFESIVTLSARYDILISYIQGLFFLSWL